MKKRKAIMVTALLAFVSGAVFAQSIAYNYTPPQNNFYIKWKDYDGDVHFRGYINGDLWQGDSEGEENFSTSTGKFYRRDGNKWYHDDNYFSDDVKELITYYLAEPEILSLYYENFWKRYNAAAGGNLRADLYHKGRERFLGIDCDIFADNLGRRYWIDPSNGCTLKMASDSGSVGYEILEYNLNFTRWPAGLPLK
ncbi:hypothetical protein K7I13_08830 [Brucepastera parasyntrophica]|uniref:hypothetical protein n=1 Tax=Brucepastera parasyntrophica TaxID=2880008 RepID=UPI0021098041|nr:hypothetical protein [Brucepastera parasyntrophica]ULQ58663.1 hypothetical protein K7I13_08830 [Brucepastera parasyntrophica]